MHDRVTCKCYNCLPRVLSITMLYISKSSFYNAILQHYLWGQYEYQYLIDKEDGVLVSHNNVCGFIPFCNERVLLCTWAVTDCL